MDNPKTSAPKAAILTHATGMALSLFALPKVAAVDEWLDGQVADGYKTEPLAQDWARVAKMAEEVGEAIAALIGATGQNPRKGFTHQQMDVLEELADAAWTGVFAIQHFTKDVGITETILAERLSRIHGRVKPPATQG